MLGGAIVAVLEAGCQAEALTLVQEATSFTW
jgi:hypothetical protein